MTPSKLDETPTPTSTPTSLSSPLDPLEEGADENGLLPPVEDSAALDEDVATRAAASPQLPGGDVATRAAAAGGRSASTSLRRYAAASLPSYLRAICSA